ncbi:MAG: hypothetical protein RL595_1107 [Planctomycetota bacterium]
MQNRRSFLNAAITALASSYASSLRANPSKKHVIILVEGAGDFQAVSKVLEKSLKKFPNNAELQMFHWSHGYLRVVRDQTDLGNISENGQKLAGTIRLMLKRDPSLDVTVLSHSAGTAVALNGVSLLNDNTIRKLVLLAPSVSKDYPIIPSLTACKEGVHVFYSKDDTFILGPIMRVVKTADNIRDTVAAGRFGFSPKLRDNVEEILAARRLRQYAWKPEDKDLGNDGGHYGSYGQPYFDEKVLPIVLGQKPETQMTSNTP